MVGRGNDGLISPPRREQQGERARDVGSGLGPVPPCVHTLAARVKAFDNIVCVYGVKSNEDAKVSNPNLPVANFLRGSSFGKIQCGLVEILSSARSFFSELGLFRIPHLAAK